MSVDSAIGGGGVEVMQTMRENSPATDTPPIAEADDAPILSSALPSQPTQSASIPPSQQKQSDPPQPLDQDGDSEMKDQIRSQIDAELNAAADGQTLPESGVRSSLGINKDASSDSEPDIDLNMETRTEGGSRLGYDSEGNLLPGFQPVVDEYHLFNSESDFTIFNNHLSSEIPLQRLVAVRRLGDQARKFGREATLTILPRIRAVAKDKEMVIRQTTAEQLGPFSKFLVEACGDSPDSHIVVVNNVLPLVQDMLVDAMEVRSAAGKALKDIAELLSQEEVHEHVLKIVLHMAHDDSDDQKITALPLLGDLAPIVGPDVCKNYLASDLHALSQDNSFRVRKATVQYFGPICDQLGYDHTETILLPIYLSMCNDNIWSVRKGCVESLVDMSKSVAPDSRSQLVEVMIRFLTDHSRWVRNGACEALGPFIATLTSEQVSPEFLKYYTNIPTLSSSEVDTDCSNSCAFNFPAVALTLGKERWHELAETYEMLVRKTFKSRKTLSCSIHEIAKILETELTEQYLLPAMEFFLKDIDDIREGVVKNIAAFMSVLSQNKRDELIGQLWELASESDVNWRFRLYLAHQMSDIVYLYPPHIVSEQLVPLVFQLCDDRMADVRTSAIKSVVHSIKYLKENGTDPQYLDLIHKCDAIKNAETYNKRFLFVKFSEACLELLDVELFRSICYDSLLSYVDDSVANIRMALSRFIRAALMEHPVFSDEPKLVAVIEKLKGDTEDVEVRRPFCSLDELSEFIHTRNDQLYIHPTRPQEKGNAGSTTDSSSMYESSSDSSSDEDPTILYGPNHQPSNSDGAIKYPSNMPTPNNMSASAASTIPQTGPTPLDRSGTPFRLPDLDAVEDDNENDTTKKGDEVENKETDEENGDPFDLLSDEREETTESANSNGLGILFGDTVEKNGSTNPSTQEQAQESSAPTEVRNGDAEDHDDSDPFGDVFGDESPHASDDAVEQAPPLDVVE